MLTLTSSSEAILNLNLQHSSLKPLKFFNTRPTSFIPHSRKQKSRPICRNSRNSRKWPQNHNANAEQLGHLLETSSYVADNIGLTSIDEQNPKALPRQMRVQQNFDAMRKIHGSISSSYKDCVRTFPKIEDLGVLDMLSHSWLKFPMLLGFLTLQGSQHAMAASEIGTGLQSIPYLGDLGDLSTGFASAFLLIFFSELGDKTFFIAALLAARNSAAVVFAGTFGALAAMTIISVALGRTFHYVDDILPFRFGDSDLPLDDIAAVCLLVYFGVSTLVDAASSDGQKTEEEQKEAEIAVSDFSGDGAGILAAASTIVSTFALVFVAEWGDKSFFSTIALAAASSPLGVIGGATAGHAAATLLAVLGGSLLGTFLSERIIAYVGGSLFLVFAAITLVDIVT
ncbi:hypothetical protein C5167_015409 [Papaver somniferum]|uniref:GDT1 family protein n=1 Tax=Papaver somniferum TaxID=3469 RepID=A0A4Y7J9W2_PAPSO|nr:GDT1-like protein 1, chloroplastic [Papaver somniferum]RZC56568.1 hypothetical protein C5167_015409 [Papaver somniferum]